MTPKDRKRLADKMRAYYRRSRPEPEPTIMEEVVDGLPLEDLFDMSLTGIDKHILEELGVQV